MNREVSWSSPYPNLESTSPPASELQNDNEQRFRRMIKQTRNCNPQERLFWVRVRLDMRTWELNVIEDLASNQSRPPARQPALLPHRLHLVSSHEFQDLHQRLARGQVPPDLESKLVKLSQGDLAHRSIEQNCRTIIALLQAAHEGSFKAASPQQCDRLLRVLAYVRKDDDAIPDYRLDGFVDDQQEMRLATRELDSLLQNFKAWRLRHQVPAMW